MKLLLPILVLLVGCSAPHHRVYNFTGKHTWEVIVSHPSCAELRTKIIVSADTGQEAETRALILAQQSCDDPEDGDWYVGPVLRQN